MHLQDGHIRQCSVSQAVPGVLGELHSVHHRSPWASIYLVTQITQRGGGRAAQGPTDSQLSVLAINRAEGGGHLRLETLHLF